MCGIVGIVKDKTSTITYSEFLDFLVMLEKAEERGRQATGVAYILQDGRSLVFKAPESAKVVSPYLRYFGGITSILGHTRLSTGGSPHENSNNHPHEDKNWVLIHNGCVNIEYALRTEIDCDTQCDTEYFVKLFSHTMKTQSKIEKVFQDSFKELWGSWSLCFFDKNTKDIFVTTNGSSPFEYYRFDDCIYFGSRQEYIKATVKGKDIENTVSLDKNIVFRYTGNGFLSPVCTYEEKPSPRRYNSYNYTSGQDSTLYEDDWYYANNDKYWNYNQYGYNRSPVKTVTRPTRKEKIHEEISQEEVLIYGITYSANIDLLEYAYPFGEPSLTRLALRTLVENPELYCLSNAEVLEIKNRIIRNTKTKLPRTIKKKINAEFFKIFEEEYERVKSSIEDGKDYILLMENGVLLPSTATIFKWYDRVFSVKYGLFIEGLEVDDHFLLEEEIEEIPEIREKNLGLL